MTVAQTTRPSSSPITVESLCHSAVIEQPGFVSDRRFVREVADLLRCYLRCG
jgi:hypothetical protein